MSARHQCWLGPVLACLVLAGTAPAASAATFTVNTSADTSDAGGCMAVSVCSLRDAVTAANAASGSTIQVPSGHYTLNTGSTLLGPLAPTAAMTIVGTGARNTIIDGNGKDRVFDFEPSNRTTILDLASLTVTNGSAPLPGPVGQTNPGDGAGIFSLGGLALQSVAVTQNTAAQSGAGITDGLVDNGPVPGPATFNGVTIAGNRVVGGAGTGQGGGALVVTTLTLINSTIANNSSMNLGLNIGGGLVNTDNTSSPSGPTAILVNDTITGNVAAQPVAMPAGDQGGGISGYTVGGGSTIYPSRINATNTIIAGNQADGAEHDCGFLANNGASTHNIQGDNSCGLSDPASKTSTAVQLGPLKNNGGPTDTELPSSTSPAVNAGTNTGCPSIDARGVTRPQGPSCDIGAVELAPPSAVTGPASSITPVSASASGTATNPAVLDGTAVIQWGTTTSYGQTTAAGPLIAGSINAKHMAQLSGLTPNTTYHYRIVATTTDGMAFGTDAVFKTPRGRTVTTVKCKPRALKQSRAARCAVTVRSEIGVTVAPTGTVRFKAALPTGRFSASGHCKLVKVRGRAISRCAFIYKPSTKPGGRTIAAIYGGDARLHGSEGRTKIKVLQPGSKPTGQGPHDH